MAGGGGGGWGGGEGVGEGFDASNEHLCRTGLATCTKTCTVQYDCKICAVADSQGNAPLSN